MLEAYAARIGDRVERSPPGVSKAGGVEGEVEAAGRLEGEDEAGGEEGEVEVEEKDLFFGERVPVGQQKTMLLPNKIEELRVEELSEMLKHIAFGTELRKPPYAPPPHLPLKYQPLCHERPHSEPLHQRSVPKVEAVEARVLP